ncbi:hypothetical protein E5288_WYG006285 [Bos mutus]|uniref:Uncharacterized protein n=1 Tax=Bos mutus TaxID=72004 RepID=A0A6B0QVP6_9CETA|nr:hypothetical protein [Bos mutus]
MKLSTGLAKRQSMAAPTPVHSPYVPKGTPAAFESCFCFLCTQHKALYGPILEENRIIEKNSRPELDRRPANSAFRKIPGMGEACAPSCLFSMIAGVGRFGKQSLLSPCFDVFGRHLPKYKLHRKLPEKTGASALGPVGALLNNHVGNSLILTFEIYGVCLKVTDDSAGPDPKTALWFRLNTNSSKQILHTLACFNNLYLCFEEVLCQKPSPRKINMGEILLLGARKFLLQNVCQGVFAMMDFYPLSESVFTFEENQRSDVAKGVLSQLESAATGQATDTGSQEDRSHDKQRSSFYPFSPGAGKLGDTGGLNAAYKYVLIPALLLDTGDLSLLDPEGPTEAGTLDQMTTLSTHSLLPRDTARFTFWWQALKSHPLGVTRESAQWAARLFTLLLSRADGALNTDGAATVDECVHSSGLLLLVPTLNSASATLGPLPSLRSRMQGVQQADSSPELLSTQPAGAEPLQHRICASWMLGKHCEQVIRTPERVH